MCGNTRGDKVRNENIHAKIGVASMEREDERKSPMMVWSCGLRQIDALVRRVERMKLRQVKKAQGRPKKTWMVVIRQYIEPKGPSEGILLDRNEWRKLIHVADPA